MQQSRQFKSIELLMPYKLEVDEEQIFNIAKECFRIHSITIHSSPTEKIISDYSKVPAIIRYTKDIISDSSHCGFISQHYFRSNIRLYTESQKHNTCLNRKISLDVNGNIKNCPSMSHSYGNINNLSFTEAIQKEGFKDFWYIHKDQIDICKDCEFRHVCTDCRVFIQDNANIYSKPAKCSYDPYTSTWGSKNSTKNPLYGR